MGYSLLLIVQRTHIRKCWLGPIAHYRWGNWFSRGLAQNHTGRWYPSRELGPRSSALRPTTGPRLLSVTHRNPEHQRESLVLSCTSVRHEDISPYCLQDPILNPLSGAASWCLISQARASALPHEHLRFSCRTGATSVRANLTSGHTSASSAQPDMSSKGYFMRQNGSYKIYKVLNSPTFPRGLNPHSLGWHSERLMFLNRCSRGLPSPLLPFKLYTPAKYNYLYNNHVFPPLGFCKTHLFTSKPFLFSPYPLNLHKFGLR